MRSDGRAVHDWSPPAGPPEAIVHQAGRGPAPGITGGTRTRMQHLWPPGRTSFRRPPWYGRPVLTRSGAPSRGRSTCRGNRLAGGEDRLPGVVA